MFDEFSTIHDLRAFENKIYNALYDYCNDRDGFDEDVILAINPVTLEVKVDNRYLLPLDYEMYEIDTLITRNEPDDDAVYDLANKYIFVR
ncbi:MAG: hypothetical protein IJT30_07235 [Muribaculaceae bacterium]|nr:hypothetical protein [Muribaculaceae bacterium]